MSIARLSRDRKRQLGQYLTPESTAAAIVKKLQLSPNARVLEPSFGKGAFIFPILDSLASVLPRNKLSEWCTTHLYGCEIDKKAYSEFTEAWQSRGLGDMPSGLELCDFFTWLPPAFDRTIATDQQRYFSSSL